MGENRVAQSLSRISEGAGNPCEPLYAPEDRFSSFNARRASKKVDMRDYVTIIILMSDESLFQGSGRISLEDYERGRDLVRRQTTKSLRYSSKAALQASRGWS